MRLTFSIRRVHLLIRIGYSVLNEVSGNGLGVGGGNEIAGISNLLGVVLPANE